MNIAAYCRVSTDKEDQLNSLETQKSFFLEYAQRTGQNLIRLYADSGLSGTKIKIRKEFLQLLSDAELGLFDTVVVKDISRFSRNTVDLLQSIRKLKTLGIETIFLTANMSVLGQSEFVLTIFGALAQEESANISKRVKFGKKENAKKGRVPNFVYGYDKICGDYFTLQINSEEASVVQEIFNWYIDAGFGSAKIAAMLNERGLRTKRCFNWSQSAVMRILSNRIYTGMIINGKEEISDFLTSRRRKFEESSWIQIKRPELQIISESQYDKAQQLMKERADSFHTDKTRHSNTHLFSTLIKCGECGCSYRRTVRKYKNVYTRWCCSRRNENGVNSCGNAVTIDEGALISAIETYFSSILRDKHNVMQLFTDELSQLFRHGSEQFISRGNLERRRSKLIRSREKYFNLYTEDLISLEELKANISVVQGQLATLDLECATFSADHTRGQLECLISRTFPRIEDIVDLRLLCNADLRHVIQRIQVNNSGDIDIFLHNVKNVG